MTKRRLIAMAALIALMLAGCGKNATPEGTVPATTTGSTGGQTAAGTGGGTSGAGSGGSTGTGGGSTTTGGGTQTPAPVKYEKVKLTDLAVGAEAQVGGVKMKVNSLAYVDSALGMPTGYHYLLVELAITNEGAEPYTANVTDHFVLLRPDGKTPKINLQATAQKTPRLQGTLNQGESTTGWMGYLVKPGGGEHFFTFNYGEFGEATWKLPL